MIIIIDLRGKNIPGIMDTVIEGGVMAEGAERMGVEGIISIIGQRMEEGHLITKQVAVDIMKMRANTGTDHVVLEETLAL